jgi:hypothetical protein
MSGCQGVLDGDIYYCKQIMVSYYVFWIPTIRIILLLLGFMAKTQEFSLRHGSNTVQKKLVPPSGFYMLSYY